MRDTKGVDGWLADLPVWDLGFLVVAMYRRRAAHFSASEKRCIGLKHEQQFNCRLVGRRKEYPREDSPTGLGTQLSSLFCKERAEGAPGGHPGGKALFQSQPSGN